MSTIVSYREQTELVHLAGRSVAEAREMYTTVFEIPDEARAKLNGKEVKRKLEAETILNNGDELCFYDKKRSKKFILIGVLMSVLALTGGMFAYTWTTASFTITTVTGAADFAEIAPAVSQPAWSDQWSDGNKILGKLRDDMPTGDLFTIDVHDDYTGDLKMHVYLTNTSELSKVYQHFNMKLELRDHGDGNVYGSVAGHEFQLLSLDNGEVTFDATDVPANEPFTIKLVGGSFGTHPYSPIAWRDFADPLLYCEVLQR